MGGCQWEGSKEKIVHGNGVNKTGTNAKQLFKGVNEMRLNRKGVNVNGRKWEWSKRKESKRKWSK